MVQEPKSLAERISETRSGLVCWRCGKYVGSLGLKRYLPPAYPVALDKINAEEEAEALIGFESHMIARVRRGNFRISHAQVGGRCSSFREWVESEHEGDDAEAGEAG
jgi:hypothetical protein